MAEHDKLEVPKRFYSLDVLRGLAALVVVFWHWQHFFYLGTRPGAFEAGKQPLFDVFSPFYAKGWLAVDLFFTLSGFVFYWLYSRRVSERGISLREFSLLRLSRLYPLHFATLLCVGAGQLWFLSAMGSYFVYPFNDAWHFLLNVLFIPSLGLERGFSFNGPIWSVSVEVLLYATFFAVCRLLPVRLPTVLAVSVVGFVLLPLHDELIARGVASFFLGGCVYLVYRRIFASGELARWAAPLAWLTASAWVITMVTHWLAPARLGRVAVQIVHFWPTVVLFPATILSLALLETRRGELGRRWAFLGDISYSSYLLHFPLQMITIALVLRLEIAQSVFYSPWLLALFFVALVLASLASHRYFEVPVQRVLRKAGLRESGSR